jgi:predicted acyl esterase
MHGWFRSTLTAFLLVLTAGFFAPSSARAAAPQVTMTHVTIPSWDGTKLDAWVAIPDTPGPRPAVIVSTGWAQDASTYDLAINRLAQHGYIAIAYTNRGFGASGGRVDVAGPAELKDVSSVIDWTLAHTHANPKKIGMTGLSYGGGMSLLAAAHDPRIKAVAAMSSWTSLEDAFFPNGARADGLVSALYQTVGADRASPAMTEAYNNFKAGTDMDQVLEYARARSASTYINQINHNRTAVMLAQEWNDVAFAPNQVGAFFDKLTVPHKFLVARPGDHISQSATFIFNGVWSDELLNDVTRWLDANLAGTDTSILREKPILIQPRSSGTVPAEERYGSWAAFQAARRKFTLGQPTGAIANGPMTKTTAAPWSKTITDGFNLASATSFPLIGAYLGEALTGQPPTANLGFVNRGQGLVFGSSPLHGVTKVRGMATAHVTITPSAPNGLIMGYLYDRDQTGGNAFLLQHAPFTWHGRAAGQPISATMTFPPTAYDLPPGHRLGLVFTTGDFLVHDDNLAGAPITIGSTAADPAWISWPLV